MKLLRLILGDPSVSTMKWLAEQGITVEQHIKTCLLHACLCTLAILLPFGLIALAAYLTQGHL